MKPLSVALATVALAADDHDPLLLGPDNTRHQYSGNESSNEITPPGR